MDHIIPKPKINFYQWNLEIKSRINKIQTKCHNKQKRHQIKESSTCLYQKDYKIKPKTNTSAPQSM
jgi:hypothetical protein